MPKTPLFTRITGLPDDIQASAALEAFLQETLAQQTALQTLLESGEILELNCCMLAGDASFRRYGRLKIITSNASNEVAALSFMLAIAPPATENNEAFVAIANLLASQGIKVPKVLGVDYEQGFILQEDLGDQTLQPLLCSTAGNIALEQANTWYQKAITQLLDLARIPEAKLASLPLYDKAALQAEMALMPEWFLKPLLDYTISDDEQQMLDACFSQLLLSAQNQPQVFVHRDYHSRNIMLSDDALALIDFQDAVKGPVSYDAVSIFKDCYIVWPQEAVDTWLQQLYHGLKQAGLGVGSLADFTKAFHLMGLQRHIKVLGIFARLSLRDNKHGYMQDLSTVVRYVVEASALYPETKAFHQWFAHKILPLCQQQNWWKD